MIPEDNIDKSIKAVNIISLSNIKIKLGKYICNLKTFETYEVLGE